MGVPIRIPKPNPMESPWLHFLPSREGPSPPSQAIGGKRDCPYGWSGKALLHLAHGKGTDQSASHRGGRRRTTSQQNGCISDPARSVWPRGRDVIKKHEVDERKLGFNTSRYIVDGDDTDHTEDSIFWEADDWIETSGQCQTEQTFLVLIFTFSGLIYNWPVPFSFIFPPVMWGLGC